MKRIKIADAPNRAIDWLVAKAEGIKPRLEKDGTVLVNTTQDCLKYGKWVFEPTTDPAQAWPIIERERIVVHPTGIDWRSYCHKHDGMFIGATGLIAAMRCYCASVYGEEAEVPEELLS